jgi:hypothetical protein
MCSEEEAFDDDLSCEAEHEADGQFCRRQVVQALCDVRYYLTKDGHRWTQMPEGSHVFRGGGV